MLVPDVKSTALLCPVIRLATKVEKGCHFWLSKLPNHIVFAKNLFYHLVNKYSVVEIAIVYILISE